MTIKIDLSKDKLFDTHGLARLKDGYMRDDETSPQERYAFVSKAFASNEEHAQRIYEYASNHWLSFSTPILAFGKNKGAMPISCYLPYLPDTRTGLVETSSESRWLSMSGGGVGLGLGLRGTGNKSAGVMAHLKTYDADTLAYKQGETRRGSIAAYLDISHPDIKQFITMRRPTSDENQRCLNLHHGVNISDGFMSRVEQLTKINDPELDKWELIDPHTKKVTDIVSVKELWQSILETRAQTGEPYLHFIDRSNEKLPLHQKMRGLSVKQSNLC